MLPDRNVGGRDRALRGLLGAVALVVAVLSYRRENRSRAALAGLAASGLLFNYVTGYCGCNAALGVDTTADADADADADAEAEAEAAAVDPETGPGAGAGTGAGADSDADPDPATA